MKDAADTLQSAVVAAAEARTALKIAGSGSKRHIAARGAGALLSTLDHTGVIDYQPQELFVHVRAGTPLRELERVLAAENQILPCDPPQFTGGGTVGGAIACGVSGPARPWRGAVRDSLLGIEIINGYGERLSFGGRVMKNVAGYDITRLMAGAGGRLGVILSATFKVLPAPECEATLVRRCDAADAAIDVRSWARQPLPVSATAHFDGALHVRLSGTEGGVQAASRTLGGDPVDGAIWSALRDHGHAVFRRANDAPLWRLWLPAAAQLDVSDELIVEWAGAQRWWSSAGDAERVLDTARAAGGTAVCYHDDIDSAVRETDLERRVKAAFDPDIILNPLEGETVAHCSA